ncbi:hypothetical protein Mgra_00008393 [Meloidogyne graminicola]|uniref:Uncharacterized protein n=1 Tax=Meloidogyne graminicola TaxID=189291 RepID=A0A8S9ZG16_9BILA|nr:hypothetical protein Mgra_00008393 [Meloidogyne graminicola]
MYSLTKIYFILIIFTLFFQISNSCKNHFGIGCDKGNNLCCSGGYCSRTLDKRSIPRYQCLDRQCYNNNEKCITTEDRCCFGSSCQKGICQNCLKTGEVCEVQNCCVGACVYENVNDSKGTCKII